MNDGKKIRRYLPLRMSKLIDRWNAGTFLIFIFIKFLQILKLFGIEPAENGWRKASGIFMRTDSSKFQLAAFRLKCPGSVPNSEDEAKERIRTGLYSFFCTVPDFHWWIRPGMLRMKCKRCLHTDFVESEWSAGGELLHAAPHFDPATAGDLAVMKQTDSDFLVSAFIRSYNRNMKGNDNLRRVALARAMKWRIFLKYWRKPIRLHQAYIWLRRIMTASWITYENLDEVSQKSFLRRRLVTPNPMIFRHPGWGLLNIIVRFSSHWKETDIWMQYHHVPVDGLPMQEHMEELKQLWGTAGRIEFPDPGTQEARPEIFYSGNRIFRARIFLDFTPFLHLRNELNAKYSGRMRGPATIAGMLLWGISRHPYFKDGKFMFPADCEQKGVRSLCLMFPRPSEYVVSNGTPLENFLYFQREFNRQLQRTRNGISESSEILNLYAIMHPLFYLAAKMLMPKATHSIIGSMGISTLRKADIFIAATSDLQPDGFVALGDLSVPTVSGKTACAVSICGERESIRQYIMAMSNTASLYDSFLKPPPPQTGDYQL